MTLVDITRKTTISNKPMRGHQCFKTTSDKTTLSTSTGKKTTCGETIHTAKRVNDYPLCSHHNSTIPHTPHLFRTKEHNTLQPPSLSRAPLIPPPLHKSPPSKTRKQPSTQQF
ncbi:hypothetical protein [Bartonella tribocorum]|uniref:Uncharacterized protein n=1 Tax=Bartonella tribocorum TaxID=85701 RepID=A0A2N9Y8R4_9HYPH|nr:hypothetical protein [Bartonella tribocorum]PIT68097.1 hypothetical protein CER18_08330 [Bartonella tribocorum]